MAEKDPGANGEGTGPLLDRIDRHIEAPAPAIAEHRSEKPGETSAKIRERVTHARQRNTFFAGNPVPRARGSTIGGAPVE